MVSVRGGKSGQEEGGGGSSPPLLPTVSFGFSSRFPVFSSPLRLPVVFRLRSFPFAVTCPENMLINTTVPDFFRPTPTPSTTPSSTPTNTATSSETATMTSSSSQTGSPGVSKSSAPSDSAPGIIVRVPLVFPAMSLAHLSSAPANSPIYKAGDALINAAAFFQGGAAGAAGMPSEETAKAFEALKTDISKATGLVSSVAVDLPPSWVSFFRLLALLLIRFLFLFLLLLRLLLRLCVCLYLQPESSVRVDWMGIRRVSLFDPLYSKDPIESPSSSSAGGGRLLRDGFSGSSGGGGAGPSFVPPPPHPDPNAANAVLVERFGRSSSSSVSQSRSLAGDEADYGLLIPVELTFTSNPDESWSQDALNALKAKALSVVGKLRDALAAALAATASSPLSGLQRALETLAALSGLSLPLLALPASASAAASSILAAYLPANPSSVEIAATPFPSQAGKIAGIAVGALLILGIVFGGLGFVYRRQIGDALGTSQRSKLRKHLKGLHARSVELQMKRKSFVNVDPESLKKKQGDKKLKNPLAPVAAAALAKLQKEREAQGFVAPQKSSPNGGKAMTENPLAAGDLQDTKAGPLPPRTSISGGSKDVNGQGKDGNSPGEDGEKGGHKRSSLNASKKTISDSAPQFVNPLAAKAAATAAAATASATVENPLGSPSSKQLLASFDESTASGFGGLDNESSSPQHGMLSSALDLRKRWLGGKDDDDIVRNGGSGSHSSKAAAFGSNSSTASRDNVRLAFGPTAAKKGAMVRPGGLRTPSAGSAGGAGRPVSLRVSSKQSMTPQLSASIATSPYTPSLSSSFDENKGNNNDDDYDSPLSSPARNKQKKTAEDDWGSDDDDEEKAGAGTAHNSKKKAENSDSENNDDDDPSHLQGSARNVVAAAAAAKPSSFGSDFGAAIGQATATAARQAVVEEQDPSHGVREWADDDENGGGDDDDDGWGTATSKKRGKKKDTRPSVYDVAAAAFQMLPTARKSVYLGASAAAAAAPQPPIPVPRSPAQSADREARASRVARASQAFFVPPSASELAALQETADKDEAWGGGDDDDNEGRLPPAPLPAPPQPPAAFARAGRVSRVAGPPPPSSSAATFSPPSPVASAAPPAPAPAPVVTTAAAAAPKAKARLVFNDDDDSFGMAPPSKIGRNRGFDDDAW